MGELKNPRHEAFARLIALGKSRAHAFLEAGYTVNPANPDRRNPVAAKRGSALYTKHADIQARVAEIEAELSASALAKAAVDRDYVVKELKLNHERCTGAVPVLDRRGQETGQFKIDASGSNRALELLGKEVGMFKEQFNPGNLDDKIANMTVLEVRNAIRAAATEVGLRMVEMNDEQLRDFIYVNAPRVGLRVVEARADDHGSGQAAEDRSVPAVSQASGVSPARRH